MTTRRCVACRFFLSRYNPERWCWAHRPSRLAPGLTPGDRVALAGLGPFLTRAVTHGALDPRAKERAR